MSGILLDARRCNARDGITGALICRHDIFLQLLEGPEDAVQNTFDRIAHDDRHLEMVRRVLRHVPDRMFGEWSMLHDPAKSWIWSSEQIATGLLDTASEADFLDVFASLAQKVKADAPS